MRSETVGVPGYLAKTYWWAYDHPHAVRLFERQWLVNLILWGNFGRLRARLTVGASLDVVDVLRVQLDNLARKIPGYPRVGLIEGDSSALDIAADARIASVEKRTSFGGLYQLLRIAKCS